MSAPPLTPPLTSQSISSSPLPSLNSDDKTSRHSFRLYLSSLTLPATPLVSDLKKITLLIRKLKLLDSNNSANANNNYAVAILEDINRLNVSKFLDEIIKALTDIKIIKNNDILLVVQIIKIYKLRYPEFISMLVPCLVKNFDDINVNINKSKEKEKEDKLDEEDKNIIIKRRGLIRLISECVLNNLIENDILLNIIKNIMKNDKGDDPQYNNLSLLISFIKYSPEDFFNDTYTYKIIFEKYFIFLCDRLEKRYVKLRALDKENLIAKVSKGAVNEIKLQNAKALKESYIILINNLTILSEVLGRTLPFHDMSDFNMNDILAEIGVSTNVVITSLGHAHDGSNIDSPFTDPDVRIFYTSLPDLKAKLPSMFYESFEKIEINTEVVDESIATESDEVEEKQTSSPLDQLLLKLPDLYSNESVDQFAEGFCYLHTKNARKRLISELFYLRKFQHLLPQYSRIIATLEPLYPDISIAIVQKLRGEFFGQLRRNDITSIEVRVRNIIYIGELVKFNLCPSIHYFECLNKLTEEFFSSNIHVFCAALECCGFYLYWNQETRVMMVLLIDRVKSIMKGKRLDYSTISMIESALISCNPPERTVKVFTDDRTPLEKYEDKLIAELAHNNANTTLLKLRRFPWDDECKSRLIKKFTDLESLKYPTLDLIASLVAGLMKFHPISVPIVDDIEEQITEALESFDHTQIHLGLVRYYGEMYNFKMISSYCIFEMLYRLMNYGQVSTSMTIAEAEAKGHSFEDINREKIVTSVDKSIKVTVFENPFDPPSSTFRIRLITVLLTTCGEFFDTGVLKQRMNKFLTYFQRYILLKPFIPVDLQFSVWDMFDAIEASVKRYTTLKSAHEAVLEIEKNDKANDSSENWADETEEDEESETITEETKVEYDQESSEEDEDFNSDSDEEEDIVLRKEEPVVEDLDFDKEFASLMSSSIEQRKLDGSVSKSVNADVSALANLTLSDEPNRLVAKNMINFRLITKKNNKPVAKSLDVPMWSDLALIKTKHEEQMNKEKTELKRLVLAGLQRNTAEEIAEENRSLMMSSGEWSKHTSPASSRFTTNSSLPKPKLANTKVNEPASQWSSGLDRAVGDSQGAVPRYVDYRPSKAGTSRSSTSNGPKK